MFLVPCGNDRGRQGKYGATKRMGQKIGKEEAWGCIYMDSPLFPHEPSWFDLMHSPDSRSFTRAIFTHSTQSIEDLFIFMRVRSMEYLLRKNKLCMERCIF
jgi:hypothetical protein